MQFYVEFRYGNGSESEPIRFATLNDLVKWLIEWFQLITFVSKSFLSTTRIEQIISPTSLMLTSLEKEVKVYEVHSRYLSEEVIVYAKLT